MPPRRRGNDIATTASPMSSTLQSWTLDRILVMSAGGSMQIGVKSGPEGFFRVGYFQP